MNTKKDNTEERIIKAATYIFVEKGKAGARMQEIADKAGINKALLHYYFKSKDKLFESIFMEKIKDAFPKIVNLLNSEASIWDRIDVIVDSYIDLLLANPELPAFIIGEINRAENPIKDFINMQNINLSPIFATLQEAIDSEEIINIPPEHIMLNIISVCVFPFVAKNMIKLVIFPHDEEKKSIFFEERKIYAKAFIMNGLKNNKLQNS